MVQDSRGWSCCHSLCGREATLRGAVTTALECIVGYLQYITCLAVVLSRNHAVSCRGWCRHRLAVGVLSSHICEGPAGVGRHMRARPKEWRLRTGWKLTRGAWWSGGGGGQAGRWNVLAEARGGGGIGRRSVIASSLLELTLRWDEDRACCTDGSHTSDATSAGAAPKNFEYDSRKAASRH